MRVNDVQEMLDAAVALEMMPLPAASGKVAIVTNSGGPAIMTTDALRASGLALATLSAETEKALGAILPEAAAIHNPVDLLASGNPEGYAGSLAAVLKDPKVRRCCWCMHDFSALLHFDVSLHAAGDVAVKTQCVGVLWVSALRCRLTR